MPNAATISVSEVLALLDSDFKRFAQGVADGRYAFWLGSGISLRRFPGLKDIVVKALEHLRGRADLNRTDCPFKAAMYRAFGVANLTEDERASINLNDPVESWPNIDLLRNRLSGQYATFLNIDIDGQPLDYLVWEAVNVTEVYADDTVAPDAEHYAIAALIKEGVVTELPSANWDGLIEKAVDELSGGQTSLKVCVRPQDLQAINQRATLIKFHGCAVRAREDEGTYRDYLVGAQRQIDGWENAPNTQGLAQYLVSVALTRPTLMLGLSAQDANIRKVFGLAAATQNWAWPGDVPAYVMAEDTIGEAQLALLANVYRDQFRDGNRQTIKDSAHLRAFAKPLLTALLLWVFGAKLQKAACLGSFQLNEDLTAWVDEGIVIMRDRLATANTGDHLSFILEILAGVSRTKRIFLSGKHSPDATRYEAVTQVPVSQMNRSAETESNGLAEAAVAVATLAKGTASDDWSILCSDPTDDRSGTLRIVKGARTDRVFVLSNAEAELSLFDSGAVEEEDQDVILIHSQPVRERFARSPSRAPGRTGVLGPRRLSISSLLAATVTPDQWMDGFRLESGL